MIVISHFHFALVIFLVFAGSIAGFIGLLEILDREAKEAGKLERKQ